eukprot:2221447-Amphidinium_carterae.1
MLGETVYRTTLHAKCLTQEQIDVRTELGGISPLVDEARDIVDKALVLSKKNAEKAWEVLSLSTMAEVDCWKSHINDSCTPVKQSNWRPFSRLSVDFHFVDWAKHELYQ